MTSAIVGSVFQFENLRAWNKTGEVPEDMPETEKEYARKGRSERWSGTG
jgi:hypothetical protein